MVKGKRGDNYRNRQRRWHTGHGDGMALDSAMDNSLIFRSVARYTVGQLADRSSNFCRCQNPLEGENVHFSEFPARTAVTAVLGPHSENCWWRGKDTVFSWVLLPAPSFMGCVSLDKLLTLCGLQGLCEKLRCDRTL